MAADKGRPTEEASADPDTKGAAGDEPEEEKDTEPVPDPATCRGLALCHEHLLESVLEHEWDDTDFRYYLEPAGVLNAHLTCARCHPDERPAGILLTPTARDTRTVFFDDGINPERYELHDPKEIGYLKSRQHYDPASREHARYPWTKHY